MYVSLFFALISLTNSVDYVFIVEKIACTLSIQLKSKIWLNTPKPQSIRDIDAVHAPFFNDPEDVHAKLFAEFKEAKERNSSDFNLQFFAELCFLNVKLAENHVTKCLGREH